MSHKAHLYKNFTFLGYNEKLVLCFMAGCDFCRYISGVNKERQEIEMTVPVLNKMTPMGVSIICPGHKIMNMKNLKKNIKI